MSLLKKSLLSLITVFLRESLPRIFSLVLESLRVQVFRDQRHQALAWNIFDMYSRFQVWVKLETHDFNINGIALSTGQYNFPPVLSVSPCINHKKYGFFSNLFCIWLIAHRPCRNPSASATPIHLPCTAASVRTRPPPPGWGRGRWTRRWSGRRGRDGRPGIWGVCVDQWNQRTTIF